MASSMTDIMIDEADVNAVAIAVVITDDKLTGTVLQNKQVFDAYPDMIVDHFNDLCEYVNEQSPTGDGSLSYTATEIAAMISILGCTEADITIST